MPSFAPTPFTVPVHDVLRRPGEMRERVLEFAAPEQLGEGVIAVRKGEPLHIEVRLEGLHEGILVSGEIDSVAHGECVRCLRPVEEAVQVDFQELFGYSEGEAFDFLVQDDHVNLEPVVRDAVVLSLPFQPICSPDCPGLDPVTGERREAEAPPIEPERIDPRWAALESFRTEDQS